MRSPGGKDPQAPWDLSSKDRRKAPRVPFPAKAFTYLDNRTHACNIINLSASGVLLTSPVVAPCGTFLRMNLELPPIQELIDVDGVVARETEVDGQYAWGVEFVEVPPHAVALLDAAVMKIQNPEMEVPLPKRRPKRQEEKPDASEVVLGRIPLKRP